MSLYADLIMWMIVEVEINFSSRKLKMLFLLVFI